MYDLLVEEVLRENLVSRGQTDVFGVWAMQDDNAQHINIHVFIHVEAHPYGSIIESVKVLGGVEDAEQVDGFLVLLGDPHGEHFSPRVHSMLQSLQQLGHRCLEQPDHDINYSIAY